MPSPESKPVYRAYLLRVWKRLQAGREEYRASLEDPRTGETQHFADFSSLLAFITGQMTRGHASSEGQPGEDRICR